MADAFAISYETGQFMQKQVKFIVSLRISWTKYDIRGILDLKCSVKINLVLFKLKRNGGEPMKSLTNYQSLYIRFAAIVMALVILVVVCVTEILVEQGRVGRHRCRYVVRLEQIIGKMRMS